MNLRINLVTFTSVLSTRESVFTDHKQLVELLNANYDVNYIFPEELSPTLQLGNDPTMVFVASGGVEEAVKANIDRLPSYVLLIADGLKNSLAASLEILSWMRQAGRNGRVLHGDINYIERGIADYVAANTAACKIKGMRVGVIGKPSGWLIASNVDYDAARQRWGVEMIDVALDEVLKRYEATPDEPALPIAEAFIANAAAVKEPPKAEVVKAARLYLAVKGVCEEHQLNALTLNCFDLIPTTRSTGCLALALLNQNGIPAGCEGDEQTLLTMLAAQVATGEPCFMANPSMILDNEQRRIILAHCTIAPSMTDRYIIRDHYESSSGVAIEGVIDPMEMTIVKCGGQKLDRYFISEAQLTACGDNPNMCRTQFHLQLKEPLDYFLQRSIGNHHVIVRGNHRALLETLLRTLGASPIS